MSALRVVALGDVGVGGRPLSELLLHLLVRMLSPSPLERATMEEVWDDPWILAGASAPVDAVAGVSAPAPAPLAGPALAAPRDPDDLPDAVMGVGMGDAGSRPAGGDGDSDDSDDREGVEPSAVVVYV